jgi:hypothetical protein
VLGVLDLQDWFAILLTIGGIHAAAVAAAIVTCVHFRPVPQTPHPLPHSEIIDASLPFLSLDIAIRWFVVRASYKRFQRDSVRVGSLNTMRDTPLLRPSHSRCCCTVHRNTAALSSFCSQYENGLLLLGLRERTEGEGRGAALQETGAASSTLALAFRYCLSDLKRVLAPVCS